ncbi:MAG: hypothetical protein Q8862_13535 [Bacteroidota bacterium]|nr:hypothetical protein [Bacteroidota bacterium]
MKRIRTAYLLVIILLTQLPVLAQSTYEPLHGVTGYDYKIKGELELIFSNSIDFKNGNRVEGTYRIKSPVVLSFNLNDLKFFKAKPNEFIGYVENQYDAYSGFVGGLFELPQGGYQENENWMQVETQFKSSENDVVSKVNAKGEIYPVLQVYFSVPGYTEKLKSGLTGLQFRLMIKGVADSKYHPQRNVTGSASFGPMSLTEGFDLPVSVGCGTFYGSDLANALMKNNLLEADAAKKKEFECIYEAEYFKGLPRIDALKLVNFLIKPAGNYETPISGSFYSDSESGTEKATYTGNLRLWGGQIKKSE